MSAHSAVMMYRFEQMHQMYQQPRPNTAFERYFIAFERSMNVEVKTIVFDPVKCLLTYIYPGFRLVMNAKTGRPHAFYYQRGEAEKFFTMADFEANSGMNSRMAETGFFVRCERLLREELRPWIKDIPIGEIAQKVRKSAENQTDQWSIHEDFERLFGHGIDQHEKFSKATELKGYWVQQWMCTDTHVGLIVWFLEGEFAFYTYQTSRRSRQDIRFVSREMALRVQAWWDSFRDDDWFELITDDVFPSHYDLSFDSQLLNHHKEALHNGVHPVQVYRRHYTERGDDKMAKVSGQDGIHREVPISELSFPIF